MIGNMQPPAPAPPNEQAIAKPSRLLNQCAITMFPMLKNTPLAICPNLDVSSMDLM